MSMAPSAVAPPGLATSLSTQECQGACSRPERLASMQGQRLSELHVVCPFLTASGVPASWVKDTSSSSLSLRLKQPKVLNITTVEGPGSKPTLSPTTHLPHPRISRTAWVRLIAQKIFPSLGTASGPGQQGGSCSLPGSG